MSAAFELLSEPLRRTGQDISRRWVDLLHDTQKVITRLGDFTDTQKQAAYQAGGSTTAAQDVIDLNAAIAAMRDTLIFGTRASTTLTRADNTAGGTTLAVTVPAGGYCVYSTDPTDIAQLQSVGVDKSPKIRNLSPLS